MSQFIITYIGANQPETPEEGKQHFEKYKQWLSSLGETVVSPANPMKNIHTVKPDGSTSAGSATAMSGYTIVEVDSMDAALEVAKSCPFLDLGGSLEVAELMKMSF